MLSPEQHFAARFLRKLALTICRHRGWFIYPQFGLVVLAVVFTVRTLEFDTNRDNLVGPNKKYHQYYLQFQKEFPMQADMVVLVESEDKEKNRQFVERLGNRLETETNFFSDVLYRGDLTMLGRKALLFVDQKDLQEMEQMLRDYRPFLEKFSQCSNLVSLFQMVNRQFATARREANAENEAMAKSTPALARIIQQATDGLRRGGTPPSPGMEALFSAGQEAESRTYITYDDNRVYLVTCRPRTEELHEQAVGRLRQLMVETQREVSGVNAGLTGELVLELDEMVQSQKDGTLATTVSLILVILIFIYGYHSLERPLKANLCLVVGLAYAMAFSTAVIGHLNILTITFAPMLIGLAIDFGVHLVTRFEEELGRGHGQEQAMETALVFTGQGICTGALTTAGAFLAMSITNFRGIQEMGIICGGGLLVCLLPMMTLLPALLLRGPNRRPLATPVALPDRRARIENLWLDRPRLVLLLTAGLCVGAAIPLPKVFFDYNLLNMQSETLPSVIYEKRLINAVGRSALFGAVMLDSLPEAYALQARLTNLPSVASAELGGVTGLTGYLTQDPTRKLELVRQIKEDVVSVHFAPPDPQPVQLQELSSTLLILYGYLSWAVREVRQDLTPEGTNLCAALQATGEAIIEFRRELVLRDPLECARSLAAYQTALLRDVRENFRVLQTQETGSRLTVEDLPPVLRQRVVGITGKYLLQIYPKGDAWQRQVQQQFVREVRSVAPKVTGTPVQLYEYTTLLKNSYQEAALYSLLAIILLVWLHFHSVTCVALALLPVFIGTLWMTGLMGLFDIPFNPANIMTLPLVIGIGVTNGIHVLNRFSEERTPSILARSTGKAVIVSGLTTIVGFGSLMLGKHRGIESLGFIMAVGTTTCMVAGVTFLPALLNVLTQRGSTILKPSGGNALPPTGSGGTEAKTSSL